jgi:hypothetical protein
LKSGEKRDPGGDTKKEFVSYIEYKLLIFNELIRTEDDNIR